MSENVKDETVSAAERNDRKTRQGYVVSDKMDKTVVVEVEDRVKHALYGKVIRRTSRVKAHDEANEAGVGDLVRINNESGTVEYIGLRLIKVRKFDGEVNALLLQEKMEKRLMGLGAPDLGALRRGHGSAKAVVGGAGNRGVGAVGREAAGREVDLEARRRAHALQRRQHALVLHHEVRAV